MIRANTIIRRHWRTKAGAMLGWKTSTNLLCLWGVSMEKPFPILTRPFHRITQLISETSYVNLYQQRYLGSFPVPPFQNTEFYELFSSSPPSKYRILCLFYVLLRLNAWFYAVKYEEQICSELSICSPRQISLHYKKYQLFI